jgi:hypothetical protein
MFPEYLQGMPECKLEHEVEYRKEYYNRKRPEGPND